MLTSHVWGQNHNGFFHRDPGFIDHVVSKGPDIVRVYLPLDAHCLRNKQYVNVIVAVHATKGIGIWEWASTDPGVEPEVVLGCAGDVPARAVRPAHPSV